MDRRSLFTRSLTTPVAAALPTGIAGKVIQYSTAADAGPGAKYIPNVTVRTHDGKAVRFYDDLIKGKIVLFNMFYVKCDGICPGMTANLLRVQKALGDRVGRDVFMYSITLKPEEDTPEVLKRYAEAYKVKPGWTFLTGRGYDLEMLRLKLGFRDPDPVLDRDRSSHTGVVRYGNETLARWGAMPALSTVKEIVKAVSWMTDPKKSA